MLAVERVAGMILKGNSGNMVKLEIDKGGVEEKGCMRRRVGLLGVESVLGGRG